MTVRITIFGASLGIVAASLFSAAAAQPNECSGPNKATHSHPPFSFETNSRVVPIDELSSTPAGLYKYGIVSCISNKDLSYPIEANWLVPGPDGWVPAGEKLDSVPHLIRDESYLQLKGCLEYGNRGEVTKGAFFGTEYDKKIVEEENRLGCRAAVTRVQQTSDGVLGNFLLKLRTFFPSDRANPQQTMLQLDGQVGVQKADGKQYLSVLDFFVRPYKDSKGSPKDVVLRPVFPEEISTYFRKEYREPIRLSEKGTVAFPIFGVIQPQLAYAAYELLDRNGGRVGSIQLPIYVSGAR